MSPSSWTTTAKRHTLLGVKYHIDDDLGLTWETMYYHLDNLQSSRTESVILTSRVFLHTVFYEGGVASLGLLMRYILHILNGLSILGYSVLVFM